MRRAVLLIAAAVLLVGPTVLAFASGGYFDKPRFLATLVAWALVLVAAVASPHPLPPSGPGRVALAGLAVVAAWTGVSLLWAPLSEAATDSFVRMLLYVGTFAAASALLRERTALGMVEPGLALGALVVIVYGLSERLVPGIIDLAESEKAFGRLEQPLTYWNAEGALAAFGLVLCTRLAGTDARPGPMRALSAAACVPLGLGVYLSYSRGAIAAALVGLMVLLAAAPTWTQLRASVSALVAAVIGGAASAALPGVASLEGSLGSREVDGAIMLAVLVAAMLAAGVLQARLTRAAREGSVRAGRLGFAGRLPALAGAAVALALALLVAGGLAERGDDDQSSRRGAARLVSVESRRYDYWRLGLDAYREQPLRGLGAGAFRVRWLRERPVDEGALEVHSLPLEMLIELGIPGLLGLCLFAGGLAVSAGRALGREDVFAPGACAGVLVWFVHATIDWDWQMPAATLPAIVMAGALVAAAESEPTAGPAG